MLGSMDRNNRLESGGVSNDTTNYIYILYVLHRNSGDVSMKQLKDNITIDKQQYMISTLHTSDQGHETMVFKVNELGIDWREVYTLRYPNEAAATQGHIDTVDLLQAGTLDTYGPGMEWTDD